MKLKNDFPDIPDFVHDMIQEEVRKTSKFIQTLRQYREKASLTEA